VTPILEFGECLLTRSAGVLTLWGEVCCGRPSGGIALIRDYALGFLTAEGKCQSKA